MHAPGGATFYVKGVYRSMAVVSLEGGRERLPYPAHSARQELSLTMAAEPLIGRLGRHSKACKAFFALRVGLPPFSGCDRFRVALERFHLGHYPPSPRPRQTDA